MDSSGKTLRFREADTEDSCLQQFSLVASSVGRAWEAGQLEDVMRT